MIKSLTEVIDLQHGGGKATNLSILTRSSNPRINLNVPEGFCITTEGYRAFVENNAPIVRALEKVTQIKESETRAMSEQMRDLSLCIKEAFEQGTFPNEHEKAILDEYEKLMQPEHRTVAVRSSATAEDLPGMSFAGQHDTYLNVDNADDLRQKIKSCFASLWNESAISYRMQNHVPNSDVTLAVVVQCMVNASCAGVLFTANMLTGSREQMVIDATLGLGEQLVSGAVVPDHYVVDSQSGVIVEQILGDKKNALRCSEGGGVHVEANHHRSAVVSSLSEEQIGALVARARYIVSVYDNTPMDIEWAIDHSGTVHILQARPITSLYPVESLQKQTRLPSDSISALLSFASIQSVTQPLPALTISAWKLIVAKVTSVAFNAHYTEENQPFMVDSGSHLFVRYLDLLKFRIPSFIFVRVSRFLDPTVGVVLTKLLADKTDRKKLLNRATFPSVFVVLRRVIHGLTMDRCRVLRNIARPQAAMQQQLAASDAFAFELQRASSTVRSLADFVQFIDTQYEACGNVITRHCGTLILPAYGFFFIAKLLTPHALKPRLDDLLRAIDHNPTMEMDHGLFEIALTVKSHTSDLEVFRNESTQSIAALYRSADSRLSANFRQQLASWLSRYGMRGIGEVDLNMPRFNESIELVVQNIKGRESAQKFIDDVSAALLRSPFDKSFEEQPSTSSQPEQQPEQQQQQERPHLHHVFKMIFKVIAWLFMRFIGVYLFRLAAFELRSTFGVRERHKFLMVQCFGHTRILALSLGKQYVSEGLLEHDDDLLHCSIADLRRAAVNADRTAAFAQLREIIAENRKTFVRDGTRKQVSPMIPRLLLTDGRCYYEGTIDDSAALTTPDVDDTNTLQGFGVSAGVASGRVVVVHDPHQHAMQPGDILCCQGTDPAWTPLFMIAGGLISELGGSMTHGAIVARELGLPAVSGVRNATSRLQTGDQITINGTSGLITIVAQAERPKHHRRRGVGVVVVDDKMLPPKMHHRRNPLRHAAKSESQNDRPNKSQ